MSLFVIFIKTPKSTIVKTSSNGIAVMIVAGILFLSPYPSAYSFKSSGMTAAGAMPANITPDINEIIQGSPKANALNKPTPTIVISNGAAM